MAEFKISVDLDAFIQVSRIIDASIFPHLNQAVRAVTQQTRIDWIEAVQRARLWSGEKTPYAGSITWRMTGDFSGVVETDYRYAEEIETGRPARDLKRMLNTSLKVRTTKTGKRYLIIPFRHNTPGSSATAPSMPAAVYKEARNLTPSMVTGMGKRVSGTGAFDMKTRKAITVPARKYIWGGSLAPSAERKLKGGGKDRYSGMYRFDTSSGKSKSSVYMTFRIMMEGSPGWVVPAKPGLYLAKGVSDRMQTLAPKVFSEAIKLDLV